MDAKGKGAGCDSLLLMFCRRGSVPLVVDVVGVLIIDRAAFAWDSKVGNSGTSVWGCRDLECAGT